QRHEDWPNAHWVTAQPEVSAITAAAATAVIEADWVWVAGQKLLPVADLPMPGEHNRQNVLMAVAAAHLAGISPEAIAQGVRTFPGVPHRLEPIIRQAGVTFINDSKATNYDAAEVGLCSVTGPVVLIAGGEPKTGEDGPWLARIKEKAVTVLLIGQAASAFAERLNQVGYHSHKQVESLEVAVPLAATLAKTHSAKTVLLSPACASFDQYRSFEHRGEHFRQLCEALPPA
ncbi:MAG: cyanophycin synthetase, partial [Cyanobacteria bacterium P01_A01_bin.135]